MKPNHTIELNEETHLYSVNGEPKPERSVTQRFRAHGILDSYNGISDYYMDRGTRAHDKCTLLAQGWLEWDAVEDDILAFVKTFERLIFDLGLSYVSSEVPCYDPEFDVCGKYDLIMMYRNKRTLIELKTGCLPMWLGLQTASYERMVDVEDVLGISLKEGKVMTKADDYHRNHDVLREMHEGWFVCDEWKKDRKRRRMKRIL